MPGKRRVEERRIPLSGLSELGRTFGICDRTIGRHLGISAGPSWEGYVLEQAVPLLEVGERRAWTTHTGAKRDLLWFRNRKSWAIEVKYTDAAGITRSLHSVIDELRPERIWILYPGKQTWQVHPKVTVLPLTGLWGVGGDRGNDSLSSRLGGLWCLESKTGAQSAMVPEKVRADLGRAVAGLSEHRARDLLLRRDRRTNRAVCHRHRSLGVTAAITSPRL